jgi:hypothetical protein
MSISSDRRKQVKQYILDCCEDRLKEACMPVDFDNLKEYLNFRESEYSWNILRIGRQKATREWLLGLAIPVMFYNYEILEYCKALGVHKIKKTEKGQDTEDIKCTDGYWTVLAVYIEQIKRGNYK